MPFRRCVGCGSSKEKGELVRFVARDGRLTLDPTGKGSLHGRGVYICPDIECVKRALKKHRKKAIFSVALRECVAVPELEELWQSIEEQKLTRGRHDRGEKRK